MRHPAIQAVILACILSFARDASCDEHFQPGHSHHGEEFDSGPRQDAYLMGGTGKVHFPVSSKVPLVQEFIEQGVGQLHGFWFVEAERSFRKAASLDPNCGIAYWGMSMANQELHRTKAVQLAADAAKHKAGLTERERMYIDALGTETGYQAIIAKYPKDLEAKAFEVWRIFHKSEETKITSAEFDTAIDLAHQVLNVEPMHPIHHALIHIAAALHREAQALDSAAKCGDTSPSIGHMWHMPTHIYFALLRFPEAAWQLEASIRTEHARMIHDRVLPDQVHLYAHNNEWLVRTLLHLGRVHDVRRTAMQMIDLPRHPLYNLIERPQARNEAEKQANTNNDEDGLKSQERVVEVHGTSAYYGRDRLLQTLRQYEYWDDLIDACRSGYIEPTAIPAEQGKVHLNLGVAYYCRGQAGDLAAGDKELAEVRQASRRTDRRAAGRDRGSEESSRTGTSARDRDRRCAVPPRHGGIEPRTGRNWSPIKGSSRASSSAARCCLSPWRCSSSARSSCSGCCAEAGACHPHPRRRRRRGRLAFRTAPCTVGPAIRFEERRVRLHVEEAARGRRSGRGRMVRPAVRGKPGTASAAAG